MEEGEVIELREVVAKKQLLPHPDPLPLGEGKSRRSSFN
jgi:hypothetical protein